MSEIIVVGGTGYAGRAVTAEARRRGHRVTVISRTPPTEPVSGVTYLHGAGVTALDQVGHADVIVGAISARGNRPGEVATIYRSVAAAARRLHARLIVVGGFGSLRPAPGAPRFVEGGAMPPAVAAASREMLDVLTSLTAAPDDLDWVYLSPPQQFGAHRPQGTPRGTYRLSGDVALLDGGGPSVIEAADFALAVLDEIDTPSHHRAHLGVTS